MKKVILGMMLSILSFGVSANQVEIVKVYLAKSGDSWRADVTLRHNDTGWDHYADAWRVVAPDGNVIATRVLYHPHENEQPFTRSLGNIKIPASMATVFIEAHDKVHGWSKQRVKVDLNATSGDRFKVSR